MCVCVCVRVCVCVHACVRVCVVIGTHTKLPLLIFSPTKTELVHIAAVHAHLVDKLGAGSMEQGNETVRDSLKGRLVPDVHLPCVGHGNGIQGTSALHAQWTGMKHLG